MSAFNKQIRVRLDREPSAAEYFPPRFAPNTYDDSLASVHFPLTADAVSSLGFRTGKPETTQDSTIAPSTAVPDSAHELGVAVTAAVYWDAEYNKASRIGERDIALAKKLGVPLPNTFYARNLKRLFSWMPCDGALRQTRCAKTGEKILTNLPLSLDGRILSEKAFQELVL